MPDSPELEPEAAQRAIEWCYEQGWSDGLPVVPATRSLVDRFLAHTPRDPEEVVLSMPHLHRECTVETAAINSAMAGCRPEYFPVVLSACDALATERAARGGGWQSTSGPAPLIVVNGPIRNELGFNSTGGVFGPGFRPNATVARAVGLIVRNALGIEPQVLEQATQGIPGRWSICIAESEEQSPWEPLAEEVGQRAGVSAVSATLTRTYEFVDNRHTQDAEEVLRDFANTISRSGAMLFHRAPTALVLNPEHAHLFADAGMSKADVKSWLMEHCGQTAGQLRGAGKGEIPERLGLASDDDFVQFLGSPEQLMIVVAGSRNAAISMVVRIFGEWSNQAFPIETASSVAPVAAS